MKASKLLLSAGGAGLMPVAPGTWGSAVVTAIFLPLAFLSGHPPVLMVTLITLLIYGCWVTLALGHQAIEEYGDDPGLIVSDEVAGQALTYLWLWDMTGWSATRILAVGITGFLLFRLFDIVKPWPACYFDRQKSSFGILMDDIAAGIYANIALQLILYFTPLLAFFN